MVEDEGRRKKRQKEKGEKGKGWPVVMGKKMGKVTGGSRPINGTAE